MASELRVPAINSPYELRNTHIGFFSLLGSFCFVLFLLGRRLHFARNIIRPLRRNPFICYWFLMSVSLDRVFLGGYES